MSSQSSRGPSILVTAGLAAPRLPSTNTHRCSASASQAAGKEHCLRRWLHPHRRVRGEMSDDDLRSLQSSALPPRQGRSCQLQRSRVGGQLVTQTLSLGTGCFSVTENGVVLGEDPNAMRGAAEEAAGGTACCSGPL